MRPKFGFCYPAVSQEDARRELYLTSLGRQHYGPGAEYPKKEHPSDYYFSWKTGRKLPDFLVVFIEQGEGTFESHKAGPVAWRKNEVLLLPPGVWHRYRPLEASGWTEAWICMNGEYLHRLRKNNVFPSQPKLLKISQPAPLAKAFGKFRFDVSRNSLGLVGLAFSILGPLLDQLQAEATAQDSAKSLEDPLVQGALLFISENSHRPIDVQAVASHMGSTRRTLERHFAGELGRGVAQEIERVRILRATELLQRTFMNIKEVGYASGFGGARRLIEAFHRHHGSTPGAMRFAQARGSEGYEVRGER
jgi:AraC-like DNA-binding protein